MSDEKLVVLEFKFPEFKIIGSTIPGSVPLEMCVRKVVCLH